MLMNLDKFFVEEMNKNGYDVDFKTLRQIYTDSRQNNAEYIARRKRRAERERKMMQEAMEKFS